MLDGRSRNLGDDLRVLTPSNPPLRIQHIHPWLDSSRSKVPGFGTKLLRFEALLSSMNLLVTVRLFNVRLDDRLQLKNRLLEQTRSLCLRSFSSSTSKLESQPL